MKRITRIHFGLAAAGAALLAVAAHICGLAGFPTAPAMPLPDSGMAGAGMVAGMLVNKENLTSLFIGLKTVFNNAFSAASTTWEKYAMKVPSTTGRNDYAWLSKFPRMRQWIGDKTIKALEGFRYVIVNNDWEATIAVERNDIEDDNLGIYSPMAQSAGESAKQLPDEIMSDVVNGAMTTACYDGQYFFDVDHPVRNADGTMGSVSNLGTKVLSCASLAAAQASLGVGAMTMMEFKDDEGRPLNVIPNILMVPPALMATANTLYTNDRLEDGAPNPFKGVYEVVVNTRLLSRTAWYLLDTTKAIKPFIFQERKAPTTVSQTDPESDGVFMRKEYKFGVEARCAGGYGFWQLGYASNGTVA